MTFNKFLEKNIRYIYPFQQLSVEMELYPLQQEVVDLIDQNDTFNIIYKRRQEGISTAISLYVIWKMIENPGISIATFSNRIDSIIIKRILSYNMKILNVEKDSKTNTVLKNKSSVYYYSFNSTNDYRIRGRMFDIIILEDFFENLKKYSDAHNFISYASRCLPINGKMIISTQEIPICEQEKLNELLYVQEIYGGFFNGKRKVLIEKFKHKKS